MSEPTRLRAFLLHLAISGAVVVLLLALMKLIWFPKDLILAGGLQGLAIVIAVDLVLGPLLTLIVFVPKKPGLKFDLCMIGLLQISSLIFGTHLIHTQRPLAQVLIDDGIHLLSAADFKQYDTSLDSISGKHPKNVMISLPQDVNSWGVVKFTSEFVDEKPFALRTDLYVLTKDVSQEEYQKRIEHIQASSKNDIPNNINSGASSDCSWVPLFSVHAKGFACVTKENGIEKLSKTLFSQLFAKND